MAKVLLQSCRLFQALVALSLLFITPLALASDFATTFRQVVVIRLNGTYVLNAEIDYNLSPAAKAGLLNGIALTWSIPLQIKEQGQWWNHDIVTKTLRFQVQYFALLNVYRVKAEHSGQVTNFSSLATALQSIGEIHALPLLAEQELPAGQAYQLAIKVFFERESLPIPLRPTAYVNQQWNLSSDWLKVSFNS